MDDMPEMEEAELNETQTHAAQNSENHPITEINAMINTSMTEMSESAYLVINQFYASMDELAYIDEEMTALVEQIRCARDAESGRLAQAVDMVQRLTQDIHGIAHDDNNEAGYEQEEELQQ